MSDRALRAVRELVLALEEDLAASGEWGAAEVARMREADRRWEEEQDAYLEQLGRECWRELARGLGGP